MKIGKSLLLALIVMFAVSCKSKKKAVRKSPPPAKKEVIVVKDTEKTELPKTKKVKEYTFESTEDYIDAFKDIAMHEMRTHKIPASITLAQGVLESSSGNSDLTKRSNNHFGIKCHKGWTGGRTYHDDDEKGECFRVYRDPNTSYKDHSEFLTSRSRYSKLFELKPYDYEGWARGLSAAGYATDRRYPAKLVAIIERYQLYKYDKQVLGKNYKKKKRDNTKEYIVSKGDTLYSISRKYGVSVNELKSWNRLEDNTISIGQVLKVEK